MDPPYLPGGGSGNGWGGGSEPTGMMKTKPHGEMSHPAPTAHLSESLTPEQGLGLGPGVWCVICTVFSSHICIFRNSSAEWIDPRKGAGNTKLSKTVSRYYYYCCCLLFPTWVDAVPRETFGKVWKYFWLSHLQGHYLVGRGYEY